MTSTPPIGPAADAPDIAHAVALLRAGGLVALPTETVYGLGADARNPRAVARVFAAKDRPANHPLIVHLADVDQVGDWARDVPAAVRDLARHCWPGPLTVVLKRARGVPAAVTGGQDTVALRLPAHPLAQALLRAFGDGICAPSANRFGRISPTEARHVREELGKAVDLVLDGGPCSVGIESTIVDLSSARPRLLRPGAIASERLAALLGERLLPPRQGAPRSPGRLPAHYAPRTPLQLLAHELLHERHPAPALTFAVLSGERPDWPCEWLPMPARAHDYARLLYRRLREADALGVDAILVEAPPPQRDWEAVRDRLLRAAHAHAGQAQPAPATPRRDTLASPWPDAPAVMALPPSRRRAS